MCRARVFGDSETAGSLSIPGHRGTNLAIKASLGNPEMAATIAAVWSKESDMVEEKGGDTPRPVITARCN
jgi:hypothetical protein